MAALISCHLTVTIRLGKPEEYLALPSRTALLGGQVFLPFWITWLMDWHFLLLFACLVPRYPDVESNPGPRRSAPKRLRVLYNNITGLHGNITELGFAAVGFDLLFCVETKVTQHRHVSELILPGFRKPTQLPRGRH